LLLIGPCWGILEPVSSFSAFSARPLDRLDYPAAIDLATRAGVQGVYVANVLTSAKVDGQLLALHGPSELLGLAYFGARGNLLVLERQPLDPAAVARCLLAAVWQWRIALGPPAVIAELVALGGFRPIVDRRQVYYAVTAEGLPADSSTEGVRLAARKDLKPLMEASLNLNESDLNVEPWRVDRDWLRRNTRTRIKDGLTYVLGPVGHPCCKLDIGSSGPAGVVIEGVYTWPDQRGMGHASRLVAGLAAKMFPAYPLVCLHVAEQNAAARRAYARGGMQELASCQLILRA